VPATTPPGSAGGPGKPATKPAPSTTPDAPKPAAAPAPTGPSAPTGTTPGAVAPAPAPSPSTPAVAAAKSGDSHIEQRPDGTLLVDGKYVVKGKGTQDDPYQVTWDQLVSVQEDYVPKDGRKEIPARVTMLDGKWVQLTGFIAFPVMADSLEDCLSMMNQWDGCCIGVPPTPYDAVEVHLKKAAEGKDRMTSYGLIRGRMKIDPQLVGGWLVGLYVMDDGSMTGQTFGGIAP
jgi:hypothetical protein